MADKELAVVLPQNQELVDGDVILVWYKWMKETAEKEIARREEEDGAVFDSEGQRLWEVDRLILEYCNALDAIVDGVRTDRLLEIARTKLYLYAAEGWQSLTEVLRVVGPSYASKGARSQMGTLAEDVAPWCEEHDIPVFTGGGISKLSEGAAALRNIIQGPGRTPDKVERVREELAFLNDHGRDEIRARYRQYRGEPAVGTMADLATGETILMIVCPSGDVAEAIRQKAGNLVSGWAPTRNADKETGEMRRSKADKTQMVRGITYTIVQQRTEVIDPETGAIVEVLA